MTRKDALSGSTRILRTLSDKIQPKRSTIYRGLGSAFEFAHGLPLSFILFSVLIVDLVADISITHIRRERPRRDNHEDGNPNPDIIMNGYLARHPWHLLGRSSRCRRGVQKSLFHTSPIWNKKVVQKFKLADIGEGITECEVIRWSIQPSSRVSAFDPLCEVQSDKASVEITSPFDGIVKELLVKEGEIAKVGEGLCLIETEHDGCESELEDAEAESHQTTATDADKSAELGAARSAPAPEDLAPPPPTTSSEPKRRHPLDPKYVPPSTSGSSQPRAEVDVLAPPSVRHFARANGVDLALLAPGSGKKGRIEKADVQAWLDGSSKTAAAAGAGVQSTVSSGEESVVELGRTRYGMWKAMEKSLEIPHFGYSTYLDLTALHRLLPTLNANIPAQFLPSDSPALAAYKKRYTLVSPHSIYGSNVPEQPSVPDSHKFNKITMLPVLLKTLSKAMDEWPLFRSTISPTPSATTSKPTLTIRPNADISLAMSTPSGLYAPTLQSVNTNSIYTIASRITNLSNLARTTGLGPNELPKKGGSISVSNVGAIGKGEFASPVLVPGGGVAIVALGRARWVMDVDSEDTWDEGLTAEGWPKKQGERRLKMGVSWSADHRVIEGAELAAFVECWRSWVEQPERLIAEGI